MTHRPSYCVHEESSLSMTRRHGNPFCSRSLQISRLETVRLPPGHLRNRWTRDEWVGSGKPESVTEVLPLDGDLVQALFDPPDPGSILAWVSFFPDSSPLGLRREMTRGCSWGEVSRQRTSASSSARLWRCQPLAFCQPGSRTMGLWNCHHCRKSPFDFESPG
jgi:hypothetical protein